MSKWFLTILFAFVTSNLLFAQESLEIHRSGNDLFLEHSVVSKENFYSISRLYNVPPNEIASYNHLQMDNGLNVGQQLKIPLNKNNFTQVKTVASGEALVPVTHIVESNETLYRLGVNYHHVPLSSIREWNDMHSDAIAAGNRMIVGFLKVDKNLSAFANQSVKPKAIENGVVKAEEIAKSTPSVTITPTQVATVTPTQPPTSVKSNETPVVIKKEEAQVATVTMASGNENNAFAKGYFRQLYQEQIASKPLEAGKGSAGVFKSTSGWQDGKYYCFNNAATPGTILKVTNNTTGKSVYAKVLDAIPEIKQNEGLLIVISNSAADELGSGENIFECSLVYAN